MSSRSDFPAFANWLKARARKNDEPFVRDAEKMIRYCQTLANKVPEQYGWRVASVAAIAQQMTHSRTSMDSNRVFWMDQAKIAEAYAVNTVWRGVDLLRPAIRSLNAHEIVPAAVLGRSFLELAATFIKNANLIEKNFREKSFPEGTVVISQDMREQLLKMMWGTRLGGAEPHLQQTNVLNTIDKISQLPQARDVRRKYDYLCEIAHPNVIGNAIYWSHIDKIHDDGSETRILKRRHEGEVAGQATDHVLWVLGWSAACLRNGFELTRVGLGTLLEKLNR